MMPRVKPAITVLPYDRPALRPANRSNWWEDWLLPLLLFVALLIVGSFCLIFVVRAALGSSIQPAG